MSNNCKRKSKFLNFSPNVGHCCKLDLRSSQFSYLVNNRKSIFIHNQLHKKENVIMVSVNTQGVNYSSFQFFKNCTACVSGATDNGHLMRHNNREPAIIVPGSLLVCLFRWLFHTECKMLYLLSYGVGDVCNLFQTHSTSIVRSTFRRHLIKLYKLLRIFRKGGGCDNLHTCLSPATWRAVFKQDEKCSCLNCKKNTTRHLNVFYIDQLFQFFQAATFKLA